MIFSTMVIMLVILKCFSGPTILLTFWTFVGEEVREMFCFNVYGDTGFSTVCKCKAQSTRKTSVFINCHKLFEILRSRNILKQTQLRQFRESYRLNYLGSQLIIYASYQILSHFLAFNHFIPIKCKIHNHFIYDIFPCVWPELYLF